MTTSGSREGWGGLFDSPGRDSGQRPGLGGAQGPGCRPGEHAGAQHPRCLWASLQRAGHLLGGPPLTPSFLRKPTAFPHRPASFSAAWFLVSGHTCFIQGVAQNRVCLWVRSGGAPGCSVLECGTREQRGTGVRLLAVPLLCDPGWAAFPSLSRKATDVTVEEGGRPGRLPGGGGPRASPES